MKDKTIYRALETAPDIFGDIMIRKIVDMHAHAFDEKIALKATENLVRYYGDDAVSDGRLIHLLKSAEENNIDRLVLCATATKPTQVQLINNYVSGLINNNIIGLGTLHPDYEDISGEITRIKEMGLSGIKLHPIFQGFNTDEEKAFKMYECIGSDFPVLIHVGDINSDATTPERLSKVMDAFPEITFIAAHLGGYGEWETAEKFLYGKNIYFDTSSSVRFLKPEESKRLIRKHGADKILFGTDYPLSSHKSEIDCLLKLNLTDEEYENIFWKNAYKLFKIKEEPGEN